MRFVYLCILITIITCSFCTILFAEDESNYPDRKALVVNSCPFIELSSFSFENKYEDRATRFNQNIKWKNTGKQPVIAFEIVILKYDAFNRRMVGTRWTVTGKNSADWSPLDPGQSNGDGLRSYGEEEVFTGIAYVRLARLKDGTIWRVNDTTLLPLLHKSAPEIEDFGDVKPDEKQKA